MKPLHAQVAFVLTSIALLYFPTRAAAAPLQVQDSSDGQIIVLQAGHPSLQKWLLPTQGKPNKKTAKQIELGKMLFFEPRVSSLGNMSCASCHNPSLGWSDGLPTGRGFEGVLLGRATPTILNSTFNKIQMWDGRKKNLHDQATGPMEADKEMNTNFEQLFAFLNSNSTYRQAFAEAFPNQAISKNTLATAIANYENTVVETNTPFDQWVRGNAKAMSAKAVRGLAIFVDAKKGNCAACHSAPNFTDNGFHNIGLAAFEKEQPDMGRFAHKPLAVIKGAFKTPGLRNVAYTAPFFHDGSAKTLRAVVEHYLRGGDSKKNLSPNMKTIVLTEPEKEELLEFLTALNAKPVSVTLPILPQ